MKQHWFRSESARSAPEEPARTYRLVPPRGGAFPVPAAEAAFAALLPALAHHGSTLRLEWYSENRSLQLLLGVPLPVEAALKSQLAAAFPDARLEPFEREAFENDVAGPLHALPLRLARPDLLPLPVPAAKEADPLPAFLAAMAASDLPCGLSLALRPVSTRWRERAAGAASALRAGSPLPPESAGGRLLRGFSLLAGEILAPGAAASRPRASLSPAAAERAARKARGPAFHARCRLWTGGGPPDAAGLLAAHLEAAFRDPEGNALRPAGKARPVSAPEACPAPEVALSAEEVAAFFHLPDGDLPFLPREMSRLSPPPASLLLSDPSDDAPRGTVVGEALTPEGPRPVRLGPEERRRHAYVLGKTGTGKSTLLGRMIWGDLREGAGIGLIDPHGDLAEQVLGWVPPSRRGDAVLFSPADAGYPVGLNPLAFMEDRSLTASAVVGVFRKLYGDSWGPRLEHFLRHGLLALLETPGPTLLDLPRLFTDPGFRSGVLRQVRDPVVRGFFTDEFERYDPRFRMEAVSPILNKVGAFLAVPTVRNVVGQSDPPLSLRRVMDGGGIFVANLSAGRIGEDNAALLGGLLVAGFQLAALSRADAPEEGRRDFRLYVDEFQHFANDAFAAVLSEARKYRLSLTLSHQYLAQLPPATAEAVLGNVGTLAAFRLGPSDAARLERELAPVFDAQDLVHLPNFRFCFRTVRDGEAIPPFSADTLPLPEESHDPLEVVELSRRRWGRPRVAVETEIADRREGRV